jgi:hypothetical protein
MTTWTTKSSMFPWRTRTQFTTHSIEAIEKRGERKVLVERQWFIQDEPLGSGAFGPVRVHSTADGEQRAVKAILKSTAEKFGVDYKEEIRALVNFSRAKVDRLN